MPEPHWAGNEPPKNQGPPGPPGPAGASTLSEMSDVTGDPAAGRSPVNDGSADSPWTRVTTQEDIDAILTQVSAVEWHDLALLSGFTNQGGGYPPARYRHTLNNIVFLEGRIRHVPALTVSNIGLPI